MMKNLKNFNLKGKLSSPFIYLKLLTLELINLVNYISAFFVGILINFILSGSPFSSIVPFIVPIIIQSISKSSLRFNSRNRDALLLLPTERKDPAFLMDKRGHVIFSTGITNKLFKDNGIGNYNNFITIEGAYSRVYSSITNKWYKEDRKEIDGKVLVWLSDITNEINLENRIKLQVEFNNSIYNELDNLIYEDVYKNLSELLISDGYKGIFVAKLLNDRLLGQIYKDGTVGVEKSSEIVIPLDSNSPIVNSRSSGGVVIGDYRDFNSYEEFYKEYKFNEKVVDFLGFKINNFINYHSGGISIIAFNKVGGFREVEVKSIESVLDSARILDSLMTLARDSDNRFLEAIEGLCAAAEYSDEITGSHIYRVNKYSELIAREIGLENKRSIWLGQTAAIHDIGKVAMPDLIKISRRYSESERKLMKMHTVIGANIIRKMIFRSEKPDKRLILARQIALLHHQEWCGKGYPGLVKEDGTYIDEFIDDPDYYESLRPLKGEEIPVEALVVSLADRYDALRSPRHYKEGYSHKKVVELLAKDDRTGRTGEEVFGPRVYKAFLSIEKEMDRIYEDMKG